jgi:hypothetical protein
VPEAVVAALIALAAVAGDITWQRLHPEPAAVTADHRWPAALVGPVWVRVDPADGSGRTVTLRWGPWRRQVRQTGEGPVTYVFTKPPVPPAGNATIIVEVDPGARVAFGEGPPPADGDVVGLDLGWQPGPDPVPPVEPDRPPCSGAASAGW